MADVERLARETEGLTLVQGATAEDGGLSCRIEVDTTRFAAGPGGLKVRSTEQLVIAFTEQFPRFPPHVWVEHLRWAGFPHVMAGHQLCLYLDPQREWNPHGGVAAALARLWEWLEDAIAGRFEAATALHHGFGGVTPTGSSTGPLLVVRAAPVDLRPGIRRVSVAERSPHRFDLVSWATAASPTELPGLAFVSAQPLRMGLPSRLHLIARAIDSPAYAGWDLELPRTGFPSLEMIRTRLSRLVRDAPSEQRFVLVFAAPNDAVTGAGRYDLMAALATAADVRRAVDALDDPNARDVPPLEFFRVDDVRPEVTTRRDDGRPTNWLEGRSVELWGCGALGSWIAELLVRAGVRAIRLRDPGRVTRGLLVRQNYADDDVGEAKDEALAKRLRGLNPDVEVVALGSALGVGPEDLDPECDLLIDATVNAQVAVALDLLAAEAAPELRISQVATDSGSATLGLVTMTSAGYLPSDLDAAVRDTVMSEHDLEAFRTFWDPDDFFLMPARGCSTPTFRGSAADVMGIASSMVSLLAGLARSGQTGAQLVRLPHSPAEAPARTWVPAPVATTDD